MRMLVSHLFPALVGALLCSPLGAQPQDEASSETLFIRAEKVIVRPGHVLEPGQVVVRDGQIHAVGSALQAPEGATQIDGKVVCAGFIDAWSAMGVDSRALNEAATNMATRTADAIDLFSNAHLREEALRAGVTGARVQVGSSAAQSGIGTFVRLTDASRENAILLEDSNAAANVGLSREGGGQFIRDADGSFRFVSGPQAIDPFERLNQVDRLIGAIESGRKYHQDVIEYRYELEEWQKAIKEKEEELEKDFKKAKKARDKDKKKAEEDGKEYKEKKYSEDKKPKAPKSDPIKHAFGRVANGELPLIVQVHRSAEIRALLEGTRKFDRLRLIVAGGTEAGDSAEELKERKIPVVVWPALLGATGKGEYDEYDQHDLSLAGRLHDAGVQVLIGSGGGVARATRDVPIMAAQAIGHGLDRDAAFRALTLGAARALDVADRVGSVERGKDADLLILDGEPLVTTTRVNYVIAGGDVVVSPEN